MRLRLLLRRLTVSAPRMAVRSALPWPVRWIVLAMVLGFCAAIGLWAFDFGKSIAGIDRDIKLELQQARAELDTLRADMARLKDERDQAQSISNTAGTLITSEKVAQERLSAHTKQLEIENRNLRDDLKFFEKLIPSTGMTDVAIRALQAELQGEHALKWQVLVMQPLKNAQVFNGQLMLSFVGTENGKPWSANLPSGPQTFTLKQSGRLEGTFQLPPGVVVKEVSAKILQGTTVKSVQSIKL